MSHPQPHDQSRIPRGLRRFGFVGVAALLLSGADVSTVRPCHCNSGQYNIPTDTVPIFTGQNRLRIMGSGVDLALSALVDGIGPMNIVARRSGEIDVTVAVPAGLSFTNRTMRVKYAIGENTFRGRNIGRGTVSAIEELPATATVNQDVWIKFKGTEMTGGRMRSINNPAFTERRANATSSFTEFRTQIRFTRCGTFTIRPSDVHHSSAPFQETQNRNAFFNGSASRTITVTGCASTDAPCVSQPSIGTPVITAPLNNQSFVYTSGVASPTSVTIRWNANTAPGNIADPEGKFVVTRNVPTRLGQLIADPDTLKATSATYTFAIPGRHTVKVRAYNCGTSAPESSVTFETKYQ